MKSRRNFIVAVVVLSCIFAETLAISSFSRHDEGTTEGLMLPSPTITTQQFASSSSQPQGEQSPQDSSDGFKPSQYARVISENHYNDAPKYEPNLNGTSPNLPEIPPSQFIFPARKLELESQQVVHQAPTVIKLFEEKLEPKSPTKSPVPATTPRLIKFVDNDEPSPAPDKTKKSPRSYYGELASYSHPHTTHHSREQNTGNHHQIQHHQQPQNHQQQHYVLAQDMQYSHDTNHGHGHTSIPYLPDIVNEVSSHYILPNPKEVSTQYHHGQESYYSKPPTTLPTKGKHIQAHVALETPPIVYQPTHSVMHPPHAQVKDAGPYFGPAFSRALKFWIPSAIFLTGVSALFPNRVKVFTTEQDELNSRPKRSAQYNPQSEYETIPAILLRREHRSDYSGEEIHDYEDDVSSPYYQHAEPQRVQNVQYSIPQDEIESFRKSIPIAEIESYQPAVPKPTEREPFGKLIPPFAPMPESTANFKSSADKTTKSGRNPYQAFNILQGSVAPTTASTSLQTTSLPSTAQKGTPKQTSVPKFAGTPKPTTVKQKAPPADGRKVFVVVRSNAKPNPTVGPTLPTAKTTSTTAHSSTISTTKSSPLTKNTGSPSGDQPNPAWSRQRLASTKVVPTSRTATTTSATRASSTVRASSQNPANLRIPTSSQIPVVASSPVPAGTVLGRKAPKAIIYESDPILSELVRESQKNSVAVQAPFKGQKEPKKYDLSPEGPVIGLLSSVVEHKDESLACQKRALCELAIRGTNPTATRFETFMWSLATLVPDAFTFLYDLEDVFKAIREKKCETFHCLKPNLDIQE